MKFLLLKVWKGTATNSECATLVPYGILKQENKEWSCEYVRRKYFFDLFQTGMTIPDLFDATDNLPRELDLAKAGLKDIN